MREPIEDLYFNWLCAKVESPEVPTPSLTHWNLLHILHTTEFVWLVPGDDNRAEDGLELRQEFLNYFLLKPDDSWQWLGCSVLEMLIALAKRAEFETDIPSKNWFWIFIVNLGLGALNDAATNIEDFTRQTLDRFIWRRYGRNGRGGLFPINRPNRNQTKIEIWYQFCDYLVDQEMYL